MRHNQWLTTTSFALSLFTTASAFALAPGVGPESGLQTLDPRFDPRSDEGDARPRDLLALQDDLYLLDASLAAFPRRGRRFDEFQRRTAGIHAEVTAMADRISNDRGYTARHREERYGADYRFVPARVSEINALRDRIGTLRDEIDNTQGRRGESTDLVLPAGTNIEVMLDSGISSRWSNPGDRLEASTTTALPQSGVGVIPAGTVIRGYIDEDVPLWLPGAPQAPLAAEPASEVAAATVADADADADAAPQSAFVNPPHRRPPSAR